MSLDERFQQLDQQIATLVRSSVREVHRSLGQRLSDEVMKRLEDAATQLPHTYLNAEGLLPLAEDARAVGRSSALTDLRDAIRAVDAARTQAEVLRALAAEGCRFASRTVIFLLRPEGLVGWGSQGFGEAASSVAGTTFSYEETAALGRLRQGASTQGLSAAVCADLLGHLGVALPERGVLVPIVLRDQLAAALYADQLEGQSSVEVAGLQSLTYAAAQAIETLPLRERQTTVTLYQEEGLQDEPQTPRPPAPPAPPAPRTPSLVTVETPSPTFDAVPRTETPAWQVPESAPESQTPETSPEREATSDELFEDTDFEDFTAQAEEVEETELEVVAEPEDEEVPAAAFETGAPSRVHPMEVGPLEDEERAPWQDESPSAEFEIEAEAEEGDEPELATETSAEPSEQPWTTWSGEQDDDTAVGAVKSDRSEVLAFESYEEAESYVEEAAAPSVQGDALVWQTEEAEDVEEVEVEALPDIEVEEAQEPPAVPSLGWEEEAESTDAEATMLLQRPSLLQSPEPAPEPAPVTAPPPPPPVQEAPSPEDEGDDTAAASGTGAGTSQVTPPSDIDGPGWAFSGSPPSAGDDAASEEARRLARLLVSEIKLYNEEQVEEGLRNNDIYDRLREDIDRSRQMYEERVDERVRNTTDYFYQELVRLLAAGDPKALGM